MQLKILVMAVFFLPIFGSIIYIAMELKKRVSVPYKKGMNINISADLRRVYSRVNGWLSLTNFYMSLYYVFNVWSICFSLLTLFVISYEPNNNITALISLCAILSLFSTCLNIMIRPKEMFVIMKSKWITARKEAISFRSDIIDLLNDEKVTENIIFKKIEKLDKKLDKLSEKAKFIY